MPHPNLEPRMSSGPRPWAKVDRSGAHRDTEPPSAGELAAQARQDRKRSTTTDAVSTSDFTRGMGAADDEPF